jgi:hypothetical protein
LSDPGHIPGHHLRLCKWRQLKLSLFPAAHIRGACYAVRGRRVRLGFTPYATRA